MYEQTVVRIRGQLTELVDRLDPDAVSGSAARQVWAEFDRIERLGAAGKTLLARRIAATHQRNSGTRSAAEELARQAGSSTGAATEALSTSQRLVDQPELGQALRRGELSPAQAAAISAAAAADPSAEHRLTELAQRVSLAELRDECARVKAAADPDPEATNRRIHTARRLRHYRDSEGGWNLTARGTAHAGAGLLTVLNTITDTIFRQARHDGRHESVEAYAFDALMTLAHQATGGDQTGDGGGEPAEDPAGQQADRPAGENGGGTGGDTATAEAAGTAEAGGTASGVDPGLFRAGTSRAGQRSWCRPRPSVNPRYLALLRVDVAALRHGRIAGDELCEISGVGPVPVSTAKQLLGAAIVKLVITRGVDVLNVTHLGRGPTAAQRAALLWTNPSCAVQGCTRARIEFDHREPWAKTRHTRVDELDPLCGFHHDLKTRLHWALVPGTGKRPLIPPDDPRHPGNQKDGRRKPAPAGNRRRAAAQTTLPDPPGDPPQAA